MIISLRGTNGSGKSTIVREIMGLYPTAVQMQYPGRRKPGGYLLRSLNGATPLHVPGHYEIANGGLDTLPSLDLAYQMIEQHHLLGMHVLYEGKNMSDGAKRVRALHRKYPDQVRVALIDESVRTCLTSVRERGHRIMSETVKRLHAKSRRDVDALEEAGVAVYRGNRAAVLHQVRQWLKI